MRILITGASGLLGLNLALEMARQHSVWGTVKEHRLELRTAWPGGKFETLPVNLLAPGAVAQVLEESQPDWVIHCAALANLDACEADPSLAERMNTDLPRELARTVARGGARLVHISTDCVFDGRNGNYSEEDEPSPINVYARTKLAAERVVEESDPKAIVVRLNLYGWSLSGRHGLAEFFYNSLVAGKSVPGFRDVYFCPLLANDIAVYLMKMLEKGLSGLYHLVARNSMSKYEFGVELAGRFSCDASLIRPISLAEAGLKVPRSPRLTLRTDKLARDLGEPLPTIADGLDRFYALYRQEYPQMLHRMQKA